MIEILKETKKAKLITDGVRVSWIQSRWMRADGTLTKKGEENLAEGQLKADYDASGRTSDKTACHLVKVAEVVRETEKAVCIRSFDGGEGWIPKSAIAGASYAEKSDGYIVAAWALRGKSLQHRSKVIWADMS